MKKYISLILTTILMISMLAGCGQAVDENDNNDTVNGADKDNGIALTVNLPSI